MKWLRADRMMMLPRLWPMKLTREGLNLSSPAISSTLNFWVMSTKLAWVLSWLQLDIRKSRSGSARSRCSLMHRRSYLFQCGHGRQGEGGAAR